MITKITFWCQKVLPVEFDDSLSYYETLCKVVDKLNEVVESTNTAFNQLETDVNAELNKKQDTLVSGENIKTVNGESVLGSGNISIDTGGTDVEGNPTGDATDGDLVKIKIGTKIYSIHDYTDAINGKLNKVTGTTTYNQVYSKAPNGTQQVLNATPQPGGNAIILRDSTGHASIAAPIIDDHISNKKYVDETISGKQDTLVSGTNIKTINGESVLGSGNISINTGTVVEGNPTGNATDGDLIKIKIGSKIFTIHDYTDAINGKLDKVTGTTTYNQVYSKAPNGTQQVLNATPQSSGNAIILRDTNGRANIANPTADTHIANKNYVDSAISGKQDTLVSGTNIKTINGNSVLGSGNISINTGTVVEGNPTGNATDGDLIKIKIGSKIYSIHDYTSAINGKLDKDTRVSSYDQVYGKQTTGTQSMINISNSIAGNSLIIRDNDGRAYIAVPTQSNHIANKYYVDDAVKKNTNHLYMHTIYNSQYGTRASDFVFTFYSIRNTKYTTTTELYNAETNLHDKWIVATGYVNQEGQDYPVNAASITTAGITYSYTANDETSYSGSIQDDVVQIF